MNTKREVIKSGCIRWFIFIGAIVVACWVGGEKHSSISFAESDARSLDGAAPESGMACLLAGTTCWYGAPAEQETNAREVRGGDIAPVRSVVDPYPTFNGVAVDADTDIVVLSDTHRKSLLVYDRESGSHSAEVTEPVRHIIGPDTLLGFVAGVAVDPVTREIFGVNNDVEDSMVVFSYDAEGNLKPKRALGLPHGALNISLSRARDEIAISVHEEYNAVVVYRREAKGGDAPLRNIRGVNTGLADPHGIYLDDVNNELLVANWGNWNLLNKLFYSGQYLTSSVSGVTNHPSGGRFEAPSITIYSATAEGDARPVRTIQGPKTQLNWPCEIDVDTVHNEIAVANNGGNSILIFGRADSGDVEPVRVISGDRTGINRPIGVAIDEKNNELWVANFGDHTALVFDRRATGDIAPKRIIRNAPAGTPTGGFGNVISLAYDSKRDEILVPN